MAASGYAWPVVDMRVKYIKPLQFQQIFIVHAQLVEIDVRLKINYLISDKMTGDRISKAYSIQVAVDMDSNELCYASPAILTEKVNQYLIGLKK